MIGFNIYVGAGGAKEAGCPSIFDFSHIKWMTALLNQLYQHWAFMNVNLNG